MPVLTLTNGHLAHGHLPLLAGVDLQIEAGERVALVGANGSGKSSLLAALAGQGQLDDGTIWRAADVRLAYVPQEPLFAADETVFAALIGGMGEASQLLAEHHAVATRLTFAPDDAALLERLATIQARLEQLGAWASASLAERAIARFQLPGAARVATLSGGQKKRLALAQALAVEPELLLLDEPTNHLDLEAIAWLEDLLLDLGATLLFITHDRRFLDRLATRIVELDRGRLTSYPGRFADYLQRKEQALFAETQAYVRADKKLREEETWMRQGVEARRTRARFRIQRLEKLRRARAERRERIGRVRLSLDAGEKSGELVAELERVSKSFAGQSIVRDFSCRLMRGDKVGLVGPNGVGKTTLLKLILGELTPDTGHVRRGTRLEIAYFDQFRSSLDAEATLAETISPGSEYIEIEGRRQHVVGYLGDFLFPPQRARAPVKTLSGGERNRLLLARLFARPANVLVLDEPTNDLDIETLELLEALLQDYAGTIFLVSHDRVFLDNVVTQIIAPEGDGRWREYAGGIEDWLAMRPRAVRAAAKPTAPAKTAAVRGGEARPVRLSWKERQELAALPQRIAALEAEQGELARQLADPALYGERPGEAQHIAHRLTAIDEELMVLLERWEALEQRAED